MSPPSTKATPIPCQSSNEPVGLTPTKAKKSIVSLASPSQTTKLGGLSTPTFSYAAALHKSTNKSSPPSMSLNGNLHATFEDFPALSAATSSSQRKKKLETLQETVHQLVVSPEAAIAAGSTSGLPSPQVSSGASSASINASDEQSSHQIDSRRTQAVTTLQIEQTQHTQPSDPFGVSTSQANGNPQQSLIPNESLVDSQTPPVNTLAVSDSAYESISTQVQFNQPPPQSYYPSPQLYAQPYPQQYHQPYPQGYPHSPSYPQYAPQYPQQPYAMMQPSAPLVPFIFDIPEDSFAFVSSNTMEQASPSPPIVVRAADEPQVEAPPTISIPAQPLAKSGQTLPKTTLRGRLVSYGSHAYVRVSEPSQYRGTVFTIRDRDNAISGCEVSCRPSPPEQRQKLKIEELLEELKEQRNEDILDDAQLSVGTISEEEFCQLPQANILQIESWPVGTFEVFLSSDNVKSGDAFRLGPRMSEVKQDKRIFWAGSNVEKFFAFRDDVDAKILGAIDGFLSHHVDANRLQDKRLLAEVTVHPEQILPMSDNFSGPYKNHVRVHVKRICMRPRSVKEGIAHADEILREEYTELIALNAHDVRKDFLQKIQTQTNHRNLVQEGLVWHAIDASVGTQDRTRLIEDAVAVRTNDKGIPSVFFALATPALHVGSCSPEVSKKFINHLVEFPLAGYRHNITAEHPYSLFDEAILSECGLGYSQKAGTPTTTALVIEVSMGRIVGGGFALVNRVNAQRCFTFDEANDAMVSTAPRDDETTTKRRQLSHAEYGTLKTIIKMGCIALTETQLRDCDDAKREIAPTFENGQATGIRVLSSSPHARMLLSNLRRLARAFFGELLRRDGRDEKYLTTAVQMPTEPVLQNLLLYETFDIVNDVLSIANGGKKPRTNKSNDKIQKRLTPNEYRTLLFQRGIYLRNPEAYKAKMENAGFQTARKLGVFMEYVLPQMSICHEVVPMVFNAKEPATDDVRGGKEERDPAIVACALRDGLATFNHVLILAKLIDFPSLGWGREFSPKPNQSSQSQAAGQSAIAAAKAVSDILRENQSVKHMFARRRDLKRRVKSNAEKLVKGITLSRAMPLEFFVVKLSEAGIMIANETMTAFIASESLQPHTEGCAYLGNYKLHNGRQVVDTVELAFPYRHMTLRHGDIVHACVTGVPNDGDVAMNVIALCVNPKRHSLAASWIPLHNAKTAALWGDISWFKTKSPMVCYTEYKQMLSVQLPAFQHAAVTGALECESDTRALARLRELFMKDLNPDVEFYQAGSRFPPMRISVKPDYENGQWYLTGRLPVDSRSHPCDHLDPRIDWNCKATHPESQGGQRCVFQDVPGDVCPFYIERRLVDLGIIHQTPNMGQNGKFLNPGCQCEATTCTLGMKHISDKQILSYHAAEDARQLILSSKRCIAVVWFIDDNERLMFSFLWLEQARLNKYQRQSNQNRMAFRVCSEFAKKALPQSAEAWRKIEDGELNSQGTIWAMLFPIQDSEWTVLATYPASKAPENPKFMGLLGRPREFAAVRKFNSRGDPVFLEWLHAVYPGIDQMLPPNDWEVLRRLYPEQQSFLCRIVDGSDEPSWDGHMPTAIGPAGTGKSTTMKFAIALYYLRYNNRVKKSTRLPLILYLTQANVAGESMFKQLADFSTTWKQRGLQIDVGRLISKNEFHRLGDAKALAAGDKGMWSPARIKQELAKSNIHNSVRDLMMANRHSKQLILVCTADNFLKILQSVKGQVRVACLILDEVQALPDVKLAAVVHNAFDLSDEGSGQQRIELPFSCFGGGDPAQLKACEKHALQRNSQVDLLTRLLLLRKRAIDAGAGLPDVYPLTVFCRSTQPVHTELMQVLYRGSPVEVHPGEMVQRSRDDPLHNYPALAAVPCIPFERHPTAHMQARGVHQMTWFNKSQCDMALKIAAEIRQHVETAIGADPKPINIMILTAYKGDEAYLIEERRHKDWGRKILLEIDTVDRVGGRQADVVIVLTTRSGYERTGKPCGQAFWTYLRVVTAMTRHQRALILIGRDSWMSRGHHNKFADVWRKMSDYTSRHVSQWNLFPTLKSLCSAEKKSQKFTPVK